MPGQQLPINKHIVALAPYRIYPAKMGGQKGIALFYQYLSSLLPVTLVSTKNNAAPENLQAEFLPVLGDSRIRYMNPFLIGVFKKIIKERKASHLLIEHPYYGWLGILLKMITGIKLVVHSHNIESLRFKSTGKWWWRILKKYEAFTHRRADINFFITEEDRQYAINEFKLNPDCCHTITYGSEMHTAPAIREKQMAREQLQVLHQINNNCRILLFNGTLDYPPNLDAVNNILNKLLPLLEKQTNFSFCIIICGKSLPEQYNGLKEWKERNVIYAGFVDDISLYFKGADIFINPVTDGGGIKTKLVEALGYDVSAVSCSSGAFGVPASICGNKLAITADCNWDDFAKAILQTDPHQRIPESFFAHFYWGKIAQKAATIINA